MGKQIIGIIFLLAFIGTLAMKFKQNFAHSENAFVFMLLAILMTLFIIMMIFKITRD